MRPKVSDLVLGQHFKGRGKPMRKLFFAILGVTAMAGTLTVASSVVTTADAQKKGDAPIILIVNQAQILAQSKAGK